jgi:hypothetical protein
MAGSKLSSGGFGPAFCFGWAVLQNELSAGFHGTRDTGGAPVSRQVKTRRF